MNAMRVAQAFLKNLISVDKTRSFSSVQANLPLPLAQKIYDWGLRHIPDALLAGDGRENNIHITLKYGLHISDYTAVRNLFVNQKPIKAALGKISLFTADDHDVVKIDVNSSELHNIHEIITNEMETTDQHPVYHPHITIAYVKKDSGAPFDGLRYFEGTKIQLDSILFSGKDNRRTIFKLVL